MLTIRHEVLAAFAVQAEADFVEKMVRLLRHCFPDATAALDAQGADALAEHVRGELSNARSYGLATERDIAAYINLSMVYGAGYARQAPYGWMRALLQDPDVPHPSARMRRLLAAGHKRLQIEENNRRIRARLGLPEQGAETGEMS